MSGILAIVHTDGSAVPQETLSGLTESMRFRGPDATGTWAAGCVGMGHTLLQTVDDTLPDRQPLALPGHNGHQVHITAHARVDAQAELRCKLRQAGQQVPGNATDAQLILHAYAVWGHNCLDHLIGDFCFAIWDSQRQELFCARDHFGIRPLYYAEVHGRLVIGNTLRTMRQHPDLPKGPDDLYVADFLMFGGSPDPLATPFAAIRSLAPGHCLSWSAQQGTTIRSYWQLPDYGGERYRSENDYVEAFRETLYAAVSDRLRTRCIGVQLSGGMDSTSIAAITKSLLSAGPDPYALNGLCATTDSLVHDEERPFAEAVARHLQMPLHLFVTDSFRLMQPAPAEALPPLMPGEWSRHAERTALHRMETSLSRVWLTGWDGDAIMSESIRPRLGQLARSRQVRPLVTAVWSLIRHQGALSARAWWQALQRSARRRHSPEEVDSIGDGPTYPSWLNSELEQRLNLPARWKAHKSDTWPRVPHPLRPYAYTLLTNMQKDARLYESLDADTLGAPLEFRHPLMDLRLVEFCLTLPLQPWVMKKHILRECMKDMLPGEVLKRPKTPVADNLEPLQLLRDRPHWPAWTYDEELLAQYVRICTINPKSTVDRRLAWAEKPDGLHMDLMLYEVQCWLKTLETT